MSRLRGRTADTSTGQPARGFALLATLLALICVSALLAGTAAIAAEHAEISAATHAELRAFVAAERGLWAAYASLGSSDLALPPGATRALGGAAMPEDVVTLTITRLNPPAFMIVSDASSPSRGGVIRRRLGLFATARSDTSGAFSKSPLPARSWVELP